MVDKTKVALDLVERGWPVVPIRPMSKIPSNEHGARGALRDWGDVLDWWTARPDDNVAITPPAGCFIVDVDAGDADAEEVCRRLSLPASARVQTPSGGLHVYVRDSSGEAVPNSVKRIDAQADVRGDGGYVLVPGSELEQGAYKGGLPPAPGYLPRAPAFVVQAARGATVERHEDPTEWQAEPDQPQDIRRARQFLLDEINRGNAAAEGGRNNWVFKTACVLRDLGVSAETAVWLMRDTGWADQCLQPALDHEELKATVEHAHIYAQRQGASAATARDPFAEVEAGPADQPSGQGRFSFLAPSQIREMKPPAFLVDQTLPEQGLCMLFGAWGSFKSFVALDLALSLSAGREWQTQDVPYARSVVYVAGEGVADIGTRMKAWESQFTEVSQNFALVPEMPVFSDEQQAREFAEALEARGGCDLLVLDTMAIAMRGFDENSTRDAEMFRGTLQAIQRRAGCAVLLVHHPAKGDHEQGRGAGAIEGGLDVQLRVSRGEGEFTAQIQMRKAKSFPEWERPMDLKMEPAGESLVPICQRHRPEDRSEMAQEAITGQQRDAQEREQSRLAVAVRELLEMYARQDAYEIETGELLAQLAVEMHTTRNAMRARIKDPPARRLPEGVRQFVRTLDARGRAATWALPDTGSPEAE